MLHEISNEEYHRGAEWGDMLHASVIKTLINQTPAHFKYAREHPSKTTPAMELGTATHTAVLEPEKFNSKFAPAPDCDRRTKTGKSAYQTCVEENPGKTILKQSDYVSVLVMAAAVRSDGGAGYLLDRMNHFETSVKWEDPAFGAWCKCRPDGCGVAVLEGKQDVLIDLKTTIKSANRFESVAAKMGYFIQAGWYRRGWKAETGRDCAFAFLVVEKFTPYCTEVCFVKESEWYLIDQAIEAAARLYTRCKKSGIWYGWNDAEFGVRNIEMPSYSSKNLADFCDKN